MKQEMRENLDSILSKSEYQVYYEDNRSLIERLWDWFMDWLIKFLSLFDIELAPSSHTANLIVLILVIIAALLLVLLVTLFIRRMIRRHALKSKGIFLADEADWTYQQHLEEAQLNRDKSLFDIATRHTFLAFLLFLQEHNLVEIKRWKTNWEYANELSSTNPSFVPRYHEAANFFEKVTYGDETVNEEQFHLYYENMNHWMNDLESTRKAGEEK
ncbi:hypothetical protein GGQ92_001965 [Gracilibacillus halotolerans]|uniref:Protein-glutamine gamma-glutamyltransferase-like C-terminal domain-containing protein n=1 Tax=Gracilibacillus halotolerans TaxID=74386 RepID=A0A841RPS4_9BACI|nr:DUF4129 domain-containing protein [Gracilibacillus halotolerans]MBB6513175.1 hypothetical protein [Gracilibacillus halotolerans]